MATQAQLINKFVQGLVTASQKNLTGTKAVDYAVKSLNLKGITSYEDLKEDFADKLEDYTEDATNRQSVGCVQEMMILERLRVPTQVVPKLRRF